MNPNDARIERVYTRVTGIDIPDETPNVSPPGSPVLFFEVVVEATAGSVQSVAGGPFTLTIAADDVTTPNNATGAAFNQNAPAAASVFLKAPPLTTVTTPGPGLLQAWPAYKFVFSIVLTTTPANYTPGHTYQYHATLVSQGFLIVSTADSPQFVLF